MIYWVVLLAAVWTCIGCAEPRSITIFHTNDIHGHFTPEPAAWRDDKALVGGVAALEYYLDSLRALQPHSIYLDAGDLMTGNPVCKLEFSGVKGAALLEMLHRLNVTAQCLGNHEFDLGASHVRQFVAAARYPLLCANLEDRESDRPLTAATHVVTVNGLRVGIVGLILDGLKNVVARANITEFELHSAAAAAQTHIDALDPVTDLIVLLTHMGVDDDSVLATRLRGADVIVGGHSHTRLPEPRRINGVLIVQAGSYAKNLGVLELVVEHDSVSTYNGKLVELTYRERTPRTPLAAFADSLEVVIQARYGEVIGELAEQWKPSYYDGSRVGNWICDRLRNRYGADVVLVNSGGLRTTWNPGPLTMLSVLELLPFENFVTVFEASGTDLQKVALEQARAKALHAHGALEMSGMTVDYRIRGRSVERVEVTIGDRPLDPSRTYRVVSIDYVSVSQPDRYLRFTPLNHTATADLLSDVIIEEIRSHRGPLRADSAPRLRALP